MKTKQERREAFRDAVNYLQMNATNATSRDESGISPRDIVDALFNDESEAGFNEAKMEADRVNAALTIADSANWAEFAVSTRKAAADVLEKYLKGEPNETT